nr:DUF2723 domain-containing protein [Gemmatimonadaceae bacterium]
MSPPIVLLSTWRGESCDDRLRITVMKFVSPDAKAAGAAGLALLGIYIATLAPGVTLWDSGEFLAAIHSLGIPHPPGTPFYVIAANVWAHVFGPLVGFAKSVNLFSAVCAASGCALLANLFSGWTGDRYTGVAAGICAGATSSLWLSATETEVYAPAFFVAMVLLWIANECAKQRNAKYLVLLGYVAGLGWSLHLTALIVCPAALLLSAEVVIAARRRDRLRMLAGAAIAGVVGASAVLFMYLRAKHDPAINQGNPGSFAGIADVISRKQYGSVNLFARQAPFYLQIGNIFEWADWQFALGLDPRQPPGWLRTPVTVLFGLLGAFGFATHRTLH